jgi:hypothetical protein
MATNGPEALYEQLDALAEEALMYDPSSPEYGVIEAEATTLQTQFPDQYAGYRMDRASRVVLGDIAVDNYQKGHI